MGRMPAGIIYQTIKAAVKRNRTLHQSLDLVRSRHIASNEIDLAWPPRVDFLHERCALGLAAGAENNLRSGSSEYAHTTFADSPAAAGDDHDSVLVRHYSRRIWVKLDY